MQGVDTIIAYRNWCEVRGLRACQMPSLRLYNQAKARGEV